jgi:hypothetical protein
VRGERGPKGTLGLNANVRVALVGFRTAERAGG